MRRRRTRLHDVALGGLLSFLYIPLEFIESTSMHFPVTVIPSSFTSWQTYEFPLI